MSLDVDPVNLVFIDAKNLMPRSAFKSTIQRDVAHNKRRGGKTSNPQQHPSFFSPSKVQRELGDTICTNMTLSKRDDNENQLRNDKTLHDGMTTAHKIFLLTDIDPMVTKAIHTNNHNEDHSTRDYQKNYTRKWGEIMTNNKKYGNTENKTRVRDGLHCILNKITPNKQMDIHQRDNNEDGVLRKSAQSQKTDKTILRTNRKTKM